ncbi:MAG: MerR family transcriptional regulator [Spirochaetaceae bacterium]|nr:MAG: MerR family transcriptional regulator [Spirochaetaceae bacterium]
MAPKDPKYTVSELEHLTGVSRRTIHFYVKEGVIAPPDGTAGGAYYGEAHLVRLKLTRELQKSHLKLSGIREAMDSLTLDQMRSMLQKAKGSAKVWNKPSLEAWLEHRVAGVEGVVADRSPRYEDVAHSAGESEPAWNQPFLDLARSPDNRSAEGAGRAGTHHTWERIEVAPGLEVLVRSDLLPQYRRAIAELAGNVGKAR